MRRKNENNTRNGNAIVDEGDELYDCDGEEIPQPVNIDEQFGPPSDEKNEQTTSGQSDNASEPTADHVESQQQNQQKSLLELAPLCSDSDLQKDANFVDELGALIKAHSETSRKCLPHLTGVKKQYIAARRQIKKRIQIEQHDAIP